MMLSLDDCIAMSGPTEEEVAIVAEHEHLSMMVTVEIGYTLLKTPKGVFTLRCYIAEVPIPTFGRLSPECDVSSGSKRSCKVKVKIYERYPP